jgi:hypothetical protein
LRRCNLARSTPPFSERRLIRRFLAAYQKSVDWFYDGQNRDQAIKLVVDLPHGDQADVARSYEFFRKIEFFQKAGRISTNEIQSLVDVLKRIGVLDRQMGTDALVMQGITP